MDSKANEMAAYTANLAGLTDQELVEEAARYCWLSAYASNNARSIYHNKCDATYDEAKRREKPWLYQRGWNRAYSEAGFEPSENDLRLAQVPQGSAGGDQPTSGVITEASGAKSSGGVR